MLNSFLLTLLNIGYLILFVGSQVCLYFYYLIYVYLLSQEKMSS